MCLQGGAYLPSLVPAGIHQPPGKGHAHTQQGHVLDRGAGLLGIPSGPGKDMFTEACGRGARQGPEASLLVSQGQITYPMNSSYADSLLIP